MTAAHNADAPAPEYSGDDASDELDELLAAAVVFEHGDTPPTAEPVFVPEGRAGTAVEPLAPPAAPESKVSVMYWVAAVAWSLPGGIGGWLILRETHPRTARKVLLVGVVSFVVLVALAVALVLAYQALYPSHTTVTLPVVP